MTGRGVTTFGSSTPAPRSRGGDDDVERLAAALRGFRGDLTVADAATRSGLALRDAERALHALSARYHGHLGVTEAGELVFRFRDGLRPPPPLRGWRRALRAVRRGALGLGRLVVRAWVSVVVVGYALVFAGVLIALAARSDDDRGVGDALAVVGRILFEALYWTLHPFSPFNLARGPGWPERRRGRRRQPRVPFYEQVHRFVFGPPPERVDELSRRQTLLAEIRRLNGRIGLTDVIRVTGLGRGDADALLSKMMLDFDGEVKVTDEGAIVFLFDSLRATAEAAADRGGRPRDPAPAFYTQPRALPPVTGNPPASNWLFGLLNGFNLAASGYVLASGLTVERIAWELGRLAAAPGAAATGAEPPGGVPLALGAIPLAFSTLLFLLPLVRLARRPVQRLQVEADNGLRAVVRLLLAGELDPAGVPAPELERAFREGAGRPPRGPELERAVALLGGTLEVDPDGALTYRFDDLARERRALAAERVAVAPPDPGARKLVFSSDS